MDNTIVTSQQITDELARQLNQTNESQVKEEEVLEGTVVDESFIPPSSPPSHSSSTSRSAEEELRSRVESGEWDNLDDLEAFRLRTPEGQLMSRTEALDFRVRQLERRLPMLLNQHLHDAYVQVLKKIHALRKTKAALFYFFYKDAGQRDLGSG
ncbi:MAG: hypothetical protein UX91_C0006G0092 [Candidatus Amesbacteria bacterium GW2011_GWB1_47_19]|nr:MAG: hypothetical protein UW51_C0002G0093 [Candidatus Amesbacteria bacterium GW2011_GWA1_44_24]KKU31317.1 MAG: hypothetical protein UX46_C0006G0109 [Candidatus Amesbacteria bacterium GW2011_GWC1_46_24]KKU67030.1 MAG: hypothetical protein UX91_C0006G0092 [Candidatus Amesbacteria bacterium GW2011_GWB1_47_19]OGD04978.1 MAG: hypothetical protein A2379_04355 [Candidatus Amesbacteria bacterium RIFOXYB1_FULL_47_13]HBC72752.1 hypothetical protein [Candidatus Amesbacteria bacterium]